MDFGSLLLLLALVVLVGAFIASPLRGSYKKSLQPEINIELSELQAERERVLEALAELDFDNEMGKVPDALYPLQREALVKRGAAVLRLLDEQMPAAEAEESGTRTVAYDEEDPLEKLILARRIAKSSEITKYNTKDKYCSNCGEELQPGDKFCPGCGQKL
jgi:hypothetical protein